MTFTSWISKASLWMCLYGTLWIKPWRLRLCLCLEQKSCAMSLEWLLRSCWPNPVTLRKASFPAVGLLAGYGCSSLGTLHSHKPRESGFWFTIVSFTSSDPAPCHSIWYSFRHSIGRLFWHTFRHSIAKFFSVMLSGILLWNSCWHSFWHFIWHLFWYSVWHSFWHSGPGVPHSVRSWRYGARRSLHSAERRREWWQGVKEGGRRKEGKECRKEVRKEGGVVPLLKNLETLTWQVGKSMVFQPLI